MDAGRLNERITFMQLRQRNDAVGMQSVWEDYCTRWAMVRFERGTNALKSFALAQEQSITITVRYDKMLDETMRVRYSGAVWQLNNPIFDRMNGTLQFIATKIVEE